MSCRLLRTRWQGDTSYCTWPINAVDELLLFQDRPNPASSGGIQDALASLLKDKLSVLPSESTAAGLPGSRVYGTVAIYV